MLPSIQFILVSFLWWFCSCSFRGWKLISVFLPNDLSLDDWHAGVCAAHCWPTMLRARSAMQEKKDMSDLHAGEEQLAEKFDLSAQDSLVFVKFVWLEFAVCSPYALFFALKALVERLRLVHFISCKKEKAYATLILVVGKSFGFRGLTLWSRARAPRWVLLLSQLRVSASALWDWVTFLERFWVLRN